MKNRTKLGWNKKAYSGLADIVVFIVVALIIWLGIFAGFWIFYSVETDVRIEEARIIGGRLVSAVAERGELNNGVLLEEFDILKSSGLNKDLFYNGGDYYISLGVFKDGEIVKDFEEGTLDFRVKCELKGEGLPKCYSKSVQLEDYEIEILTASNQMGGRL